MTWIYIGVGLLIIILAVWLLHICGLLTCTRPASDGRTDHLARLFAKGRDPNQQNSTGITALMLPRTVGISKRCEGFFGRARTRRTDAQRRHRTNLGVQSRSWLIGARMSTSEMQKGRRHS